jgi:hypothetical protein
LDLGFTGGNIPIRQDAEFQGLEFIPDPLVQTQWQNFWPAKAQHWDAVGIAHFDNHDEWLLVEAKAHAEELGENEPCRAVSPASLGKIRSALLATKNALGLEGVPIECWLEHYYQTCNRYAALHFLRKVCEPAIPTRLLFIYFYGETRSEWTCPASPEEWQAHLTRMDEITGICHSNLHSAYVHRLFVPIHPAINYSG